MRECKQNTKKHWGGRNILLKTSISYIERGVIYLEKLNLRQKKFGDGYIASGNVTESAIKAGYSENYAKAQGHKLLENVGIKRYIEDKLKEIDQKKIANIEEVQEFWANTLRDENCDMRHRVRVSELIAKSQGAFIEKVDLTGNITTKKDPFDGMTTEELREIINK